MVSEPLANFTGVIKGHNRWLDEKCPVRSNVCRCYAVFASAARVIAEE